MPDWAVAVLDGLTGEFGVIVALAIIIYFLWRLYREEQRERKAERNAANERIDGFQLAVQGLTEEIRARNR